MNIPKIMVFRPTLEEFSDFSRYIQYMESQGAHFAGVAKIIPPKEWFARQNYDNIDNFIIPAPIEQVVSGQKGLYTQYNIQKKPLTVKEFRHLTNTPRYEPPFHESYDELERIYWKNITFNSAIYGADISGSLYDQDVDVWNVARLNTLLDVIENDSGVKIEGVNTAYLYFGMWKTTFAWHTEDMDLYSINYVHFGAPKSWYAIPPEHGKRLERLAAGFYPNDKSNCSAFLRHKMTLISPSVLRQYGIPVNKITQEAGEFMVTFPYGYHAGFNHGFNCAESTNFASERWINYGKAAEKCTCRNDTVTIDMDIFVQLFQPDQYEEWKTQKQEAKVCFDEIPYPPDMSAPNLTWKEKIEEYKKFFNVKPILEKFSKSKRKSTAKTKPSPSKSPHKQKKAKRKSSLEPSRVKASSSKLEDDSVLPTVALEPISTAMVDLPGVSGSPLPHQSLFDRVKNGVRRKSSAKSLSSEEYGEKAIANPSIKSDLKRDVEPGKTTKLVKTRLKTTTTSTCTVKCEPLSSLPHKVISESPYVVKVINDVETKKNLKRRHPVSEKSSKKTCSDVLVKCAHGSGNVSGSGSNELPTKPSPVPRLSVNPDLATFKEEVSYNETTARLAPYCAVCSLFQPYFKTPISDFTTKRGLPSCLPHPSPAKPRCVAGDRTKPLIPEVSFASNVDTPSPLAECKLLDEDGRSPLLQCSMCKVQVHSSCYGVVEAGEEPWVCVRCKETDWSAKCCLCCMKGGALKKVCTGPDVPPSSKWAHIVCAIALPEVYFERTVQRDSINISKLSTKRLKLKCIYRSQSSACTGVCLQCCSSRCTVSFHTTCAHAAGILIEPGNWPLSVFAHCYKHTLLKTKGKEPNLSPVLVDNYVIAKHKNGKYYHARVAKLKRENFYKANFFKDNSWSDNLYAEDIVSHDWSSGELPVVGSLIDVKWTDGELYEAEYRGHSMQESIKVEFEDGLLMDLERNEIFTIDDPLPAKIRRKLRTQQATPLKPVGSE